MSILFRKVKSAGPFRFNFSKSGISTRVGIKGLGISIGKRGTYLNAGIPGSGIYSRTKLSNNAIYERKLSKLSNGIWAAIQLLGIFILFLSVFIMCPKMNDPEVVDFFPYYILFSVSLIVIGFIMKKIRRNQWIHKIHKNNVAVSENNAVNIDDIIKQTESYKKLMNDANKYS